MRETRIFNHGRVIWQTADPDVGCPEVAIAAHVDSGETICLEQEGRSIVLTVDTIPDLIRNLKGLRAAVLADRKRRALAAGGEG